MSSAINETVLWAAVASRIGFFSKETSHQIPAIPGIYAWFLPLWLYDSEPERFIALIQNVYLADDRASEGLQTRLEHLYRASNLGDQWDELFTAPGEPALFTAPPQLNQGDWDDLPPGDPAEALPPPDDHTAKPSGYTEPGDTG